MVELLVDSGSDVNAKSGFNTSLSELVSSYYECVKKYEYTALMFASEIGLWRIAELLIRRGADVNAVSWTGFTPLMLASLNNSPECVKLLLRANANINYRVAYDNSQSYGRTALMFSAIGNSPECAELLMKSGADLHVKDMYGKTALAYARELKPVSCIELLELFGG
jgi:ankyrin repeat protein